jgi:hypothetical protein
MVSFWRKSFFSKGVGGSKVQLEEIQETHKNVSTATNPIQGEGEARGNSKSLYNGGGGGGGHETPGGSLLRHLRKIAQKLE